MEFLWVICADGPLMSQFQNWASRMYSWLMRQGTLSTKSLIDCLPSSLAKLSLADCNLRDDVMLNNLSTLPCLEFLDLSENPLQHLPESINSLTRLDSLVLQRCTRLKSLPSLPSSLETVLMSNFGPLLGLLDVYIFGSKEEPDKLQGMFKLDPMNQFDMEMIYNVGLQKSESVFHDGGIRNIYVAVREIPDCAKIRIEAKDKDFEYSPEIFGIPEANEDMLWLSHWTLSYMLETGDSVACSVILPSSFQVKKFGIHLVYPCQNPTKKEDHNIQYLPLPENSS
ncbi:unnamed protein product [Dovyalis caffra]|uniref:Uncharacterized protein n=1 Tax=Dovyalis caffra TaxID=77055 RepID=A0AAV1RZL9_9ROSI|nr:unnamed protein product [Dovyalis caffra]